MAHKPSLRICDVQLAQTGTEAIAVGSHKVQLPSTVTKSGKRETVDVDVSEKGRDAIAKLERDAQDATRKAYEPLLALLEKIKE